MKYQVFFKIDTANIQIISIVRNPYYRIISDLFWFRLINKTSNQQEVYEKIMTILQKGHVKYDNHFLPQYLYITDANENLINDIVILKTESLNSDMIKHGFDDFRNNHNINRENVKNYDDYLNMDSIKAINIFYEKDFRLFGYPMK